jgi:hypothetical protein
MPDVENVVEDEEAERSEDPEALERAVRERRAHLLADVRELERVVRAKLDVKKRLRERKDRALVRVESVAERLVRDVRARPVPYLIAGAALLLVLFRPRRRHWQLVLK